MSAQMSNQQPAELAGVPNEWAEGHLATIFSRWHPFLSRGSAQSQELLIAEAGVQPGDTVLDVACGSGIPALRLAELVGPNGRVFATDPSPIFLAATAENATGQGLTNLDTVQASAATLPFRPDTFDAATCHMGVMFFTDVTAGLARIRDAVKPGKRAAFVAWGPDAENALATAFWSVAARYLPPGPAADPSIPDDQVPKQGRFGASGSLSRALAGAGFQDVRERYEQITFAWPGHVPSLLEFWMQITRVGERVPVEHMERFEQEVMVALGQYAEGETVRLPAKIVVASGAA
jgi:ubiquinone/menaquinone biosynthesis C-methylase UbiE